MEVVYFLKEVAVRQITLFCRGESKVQASFVSVYASKINAYLNMLERTSLMVQ